MSSTVLFFLREINRFLETLSSFCIFEKALFLDPRDLILERFESRGSSFECQLTFERYCTSEWQANRFPRAKLEENCELRGTDNVQEQISEHILGPNGGYCLYYPSNLFHLHSKRDLEKCRYVAVQSLPSRLHSRVGTSFLAVTAYP